ncbi:hypothetical protein BCR33DRAFT_850817 [Rhizoclosmatium globosum]|uniref:Uncharacterized protein n=1 Tax=Rhizoclosmatium globosum TaxID=329046 RepID=A0A1Y2CB89_9FUNG|nr:hypothetical protein BCR33DRAFT_850817 [Rhizoclosmatium globosum]|eukprot:ORY44206.1 hypothetical protein BCR33DRAFT_850817 [Rhizoclosmatium globosum]
MEPEANETESLQVTRLFTIAARLPQKEITYAGFVRISILWTLFGITLAGLSYSSYFIFGIEKVSLLSKNQTLAMTAFNIQLLSMAFGAAGLCCDFAYQLRHPDYTGTGQYICIAIFELSYIHYSWARSQHIAFSVLPWGTKVCSWVVFFSPFLLIPQVIPPLLSAAGLSGNVIDILFIYLPVLAGVVTVLFDCFLLIAFFIYIRRHTVMAATDQSPPQFMIITKFGGIACIVGLTSVALLAAGTMSDDTDFLQNLSVGSTACVVLVFFVLLRMKVVLHWNEIRERMSESNRMELAKVLSTGGRMDSISVHNLKLSLDEVFSRESRA